MPARKQPRPPAPTAPPPFAPRSPSAAPLLVHLDAYAYVHRYHLALDFHAVAGAWLADHGYEFRPGDAQWMPRERFPF